MSVHRRRLLQLSGVAAMGSIAGCSTAQTDGGDSGGTGRTTAELNYEEWTATQDSMTVAVDRHDLDVAYYEAGEGPLVVLLHGIPTSSFIWRHVVDPLADSYRVVVPDMVGYGNSAMYDGFDRSIRAQERMVESLVDELGAETLSFVGHDLGGGVGLRYAVHNAASVDQLVLSNAVSYDSWPVEVITDLGVPSTIADMSVEEVQTMLEGLFQRPGDAEYSQTFVDAMTAPWNSEAGVVSLSRNAVATNTNHTTEIDPTGITAETLLLWGADDSAQPISWGERLADDIETSTLRPVENAGHWVTEDQPETYREELVAFLTYAG